MIEFACLPIFGLPVFNKRLHLLITFKYLLFFCPPNNCSDQKHLSFIVDCKLTIYQYWFVLLKLMY